jgi:hypothetical protein
MAEPTVSTPQSSNENGGPKITKDRACPFCNQAFTSSSLGRHLDLYIKPKNPKPPDGVHDVDEIRRMRGNITRRQSRISSVKRDSSTPAPPSATASSTAGANASVRQILDITTASHVGMQSPTAAVERFEEKMGVRFNKPGWESTGVINDLPPRLERLEPRSDARRELPKHHMLKSDLEQRQKIAEELENGRAAELALQEVLGSVRDARYVPFGAKLEDSTDLAYSTWYSGRGLFEFDFFALNFPTLCLRILPAPSTILSPTPFATAESWSIHPPGQQQYNALNRAIEDRSRVVQRQWQARPDSTSSQIPSEVSDLNKFYSHTTDAYHHWNQLTAEVRQEMWQLEILRSYSLADQDRKESRNTIDSLRRQIDYMTTSLERANAGWNGQASPNEHPLTPYSALTSLRLSNDLMKELCKQGVDFRGWDYARLIDKWKGIAREERKAVHGLGAQRALPTPVSNRQHSNHASHSTLNGHVQNASRSASTASAFSVAPPTRIDSMDSDARDADADADGDDDADGDADGDEDINDSMTETEETSHRHHQHQRNPSDLQRAPVQQHSTPIQRHNPPLGQHNHAGQPIQSLPPQQSNGGSRFGWNPQELGVTPSRAYGQHITRLPPGPDDWKREMAHAAMEGVEGPAAGS